MSDVIAARPSRNQAQGRMVILRRFGAVNALALGGYLVAFAGSIVLAHQLAPAALGVLAVANAVAGYAALGARFGTELTLVKTLGEALDAREEFCRQARLRGQLATLVAIGITLGSFALLPPLTALLVVGSTCGALILVLDPGPLFDLQRRTSWHAGASLVRQLIFTLAAVGAVFWWDDQAALQVLTWSRIPVALLFLWYAARAAGLRPADWQRPRTPGAMATLLRRNARPWLALLAHQIYLNADQLLIAAWLGTATLAPYAIATSLAQIGLLSTGAWHRVLNPGLIEAQRRGDRRRYHRTLGATIGVAVALGVAFWLLAPLVITLVYPRVLHEAVRFVTPLALWIVLSGTGGYAAYALLAEGRDGAYLGSVLIAAAFNLTANCYAIPTWGALGAAWTTVLAQTLASGLTIALSLRRSRS